MISTGTVIKSGKTRTPITLGPALARGGEGVVFDIQGNSNRVAKVYLQPVTSMKAEKLAALMKMASPQLLTVSAWPEETLLDFHGRIVGFMMPAIRQGRPLHCYITPSDRQRYAPNATFQSLLVVAGNLARAVMSFHQAGVVLSDINFSNFLVLPNGTVRVIDVDSVQIATKAKYRATVAMEEFIPPELQGRRVADNPRTTDHDNFGLSVLIFLLLVQGRHPFSGAGALPIGEAIRQTLHPFQRHRGRTCPFCVLGIKPEEILSEELVSLFKASFGSSGGWLAKDRPSAADWMAALDRHTRSLVVCSANAAHGHSKSSSSCPWCRIEAKGLPALFAPTPRSRLPKPPPPGILARWLGS